MPELAAHLERVAKRERLAQQWAQSWLDTQSKAPGINLGEMEQSLAGMLLRWGAQYAKDESAAALAACARESEKSLQKALSDLYHAVSGVGFGHDVKAQKQRLADALKEAGTLLAALERAVGEKGQLEAGNSRA